VCVMLVVISSVCLSARPSIRPSVSPSACLSICLSIPVAPTWSIGHSLQFLNLRQSVKLLGWGINQTQGHYLHRTTQT
jgi:hypothetical protein